jgi:hypothetical protein
MHQWIADGMNMVPKDVMPKIPLAMQVIDNGQVVVSVDTDSEVHRSVASGIKTYISYKEIEMTYQSCRRKRESLKGPTKQSSQGHFHHERSNHPFECDGHVAERHPRDTRQELQQSCVGGTE